MNKNDFRLQMPLWNAGLIFILMIMLFSGVYAVETSNNDFQNIPHEDGTFLTFLSNNPAFIPFMGGSILVIIFIFLFSLKLNQYNKMNPTRKMKLFSLSSELVDDDEMMQQITNAATRKVYVYYSNIIPLILLLLFFPLHHYVYIFALSFLIIGQYVIYYRHLSKYAEGLSKTHVPLFTRRIVTTTFAVLFIFAAAISGLFYKLEKDLQADIQFMENYMKDCLDKGGTFTLNQTTSGSDMNCEHE